MTKLIVILLYLGVSLASEQGDTLEPSVLVYHPASWVEHVGKAAAEVREMASRLQHMATVAAHPDVQRLAELYRENQHFIHHCDFTSELQGFPSCFNVTTDLANVTILFINGYQLADQLGAAVVVLLNELNKCPSEHIWDQVTCYKDAFKDIQFDIKEYSTYFNQFLSNATVVLQHFSIDIKSCLSFSEMFLSGSIESAIELCKLDLKENNFFQQ